MRKLFLLCLFCLSLFNSRAQNKTFHLFDSLPTNFSYQLNVDSFVQRKFREEAYRIRYFKDSIVIGCYSPVKVKPVFSLLISHPFLFDGINFYTRQAKKEHKRLVKSQTVSNSGIILYAIKKENPEKDSILLKALKDYCIYGQIDYSFQSKEYILFTHGYGEFGAGQIRGLSEVGFWPIIEKKLVENLNSQTTLEAHFQAIKPNNNPYHKDLFIRGKYMWRLGKQQPDSLRTTSETPSNQKLCGHTFLKIKRNNRAREIANYNQEKSNWYRGTLHWYKDSEYIYLYNGRIQPFKIVSESTLIHLSEKFFFYKVLK